GLCARDARQQQEDRSNSVHTLLLMDTRGKWPPNVSGHTRTIELDKSHWFGPNNLPVRDQRDGCRARCSPEGHKERSEHILPYSAGHHRRWACRTWPDRRESRLLLGRKCRPHRRWAVARLDSPPRLQPGSPIAFALQPELDESRYSSATGLQ